MHGEDPGGSVFDNKFGWKNGFNAWCGIEGNYVTIWREGAARNIENPVRITAMGVMVEEETKYSASKVATRTEFSASSLTVAREETSSINLVSHFSYEE